MISDFSIYRIENIQDSWFDETWKLYENSFPEYERRPLFIQKWTLRNPDYHCDIVLQDQKLIALLFWWNLKSFRYIEHFAIQTDIRNQGFGSQLLSQFLSQNALPVLLEVEPEPTEINFKRIRFYEKLSFAINPFPYAQPPYKLGTYPIPLHLMSYPNALSQEDFTLFVKSIYHNVYGVKEEGQCSQSLKSEVN